jgi:DNA-binding SARP family transcriptional activator
MEFRILGPLYADAGSGDGPAVIAQPLLQSTLAVLLLRANRPCPRSLLIEALWGTEPPGSPEAALRVCISRLRRSLGPCAARLESIGTPGGSSPGHRQQRGYLMVVRPGELDVDEFTDLAEQGQAELDTGNPAAAANYLVQALALWGDPPLPDLPGTEIIRPAIVRLRNLRQATMDTLIDARLAAGEHDRVLGPLRAAVLANPGRERTSAQLMKACHAMGMRKEALDVYQAARLATLEQQGAEPGPVLAVLYRQILAEELATGSARRAIRLAPAPPAGAGALAGPQAPAPPADFTGRSAEVAAVVRHLSSPGIPVAVLTGGPGSGKSSVACAVAIALRRQFPDGQLYVELGGASRPRDPGDLLANMLQTLGLQATQLPAAVAARAALFRSLIADRRVMILADDAASAAQVRPLLPGTGGAAVLVTSRSQLAGLAAARIVQLDDMPGDEAHELLASVAGAGRVSAEPQAACAVLTACAGLPLALRLAGTILATRPGLSVARLAQDLGAGLAFDVLAAEDVSLRAAIGSSFEVLTDGARNALRLAVAAFPGEIPDVRLSELASGDASVAGQLTAAGLLRPVPSEAAGISYRVHALTRAYARHLGPVQREPEHPCATADRRPVAGGSYHSQ